MLDVPSYYLERYVCVHPGSMYVCSILGSCNTKKRSRAEPPMATVLYYFKIIIIKLLSSFTGIYTFILLHTVLVVVAI